ncbi:MAG: hypothetical protein IT370_32130 [Deltaproteobacteria bacterium]|nr:hypothetical protein [Deltaproteobacteria bacterium]
MAAPLTEQEQRELDALIKKREADRQRNAALPRERDPAVPPDKWAAPLGLDEQGRPLPAPGKRKPG